METADRGAVPPGNPSSSNLNRMRVALKRLRDFSVPKRLVEVDPRGFIVRHHSLKKLVEKAVGLVATFVQALEAAGADAELKRRVALFRSLTESGSQLDEARREAHEQVLSIIEKLKSNGGAVGRVRPSRRPKINLVGRGRRGPIWEWIADEPIKVQRFLGELNQIVRNLPEALAYADLLSGLTPVVSGVDLLSRWRDELFAFSIIANRDHLLGYDLIARCGRVLDVADGSFDEHQKVVEFIMNDFADRLGIVREAFPDSTEPQETLDAEALQDYHDQLNKLYERIEEAKRLKQEGPLEQLQRDSLAIEKELKRATGIGKRSRRLDTPDQEKARQTVKKALDRVFLRFEKGGMQSMATHFRKHINTGLDCVYHPPQNFPKWVF